jgi:signal transduction histidine kinase
MSVGSAGARRMRRHTWQILLIGFALIGSVFVAQDLITRYLSASTQERAGRVESASLASADEVNRIDRDAVQIQLLVTEHIAETNVAAMASIEKDIDAQLLDIEHASRAYERLIDFPDEASEWAEARALLGRFRASVAGALALSRQNLNVEARARWKASHAAYADLAPTLAALIALNRQEALTAADEIQTAERRTRRVNDVIRFAGLSGVVWLAYWVIKRVLAYERQLTQSAERLAQQNHDLDAFAGRVAHDLKNALGPARIFSELLRRATTDPQRVRELAEVNERTVSRTSRVIDSLLAFARASHDVDPNTAASVRDAVESVLDETTQVASHLGATMEVDAIPDAYVRCEPGLLHAVLGNLVSNAVKFLAGRPVRRVRIHVSQDDRSCRIEVADTGPGIPADKRQAIFEPFYRIDVALNTGSGIGLATVRRIVDACHGYIAVESEEGQGTRFVVWLPLANPDRARQDRPQDGLATAS